MTKMIFNALRAVANEHRIPEQDTDALVAALGEDLEAAIADRLRELSVDQSRTLRGHTELEARYAGARMSAKSRPSARAQRTYRSATNSSIATEANTTTRPDAAAPRAFA